MDTNAIAATGVIPKVCFALLLALGACASTDSADKADKADKTASSSAPAGPNPPLSGQLTNEVSAMADVVAVDQASRLVTLRREDGKTLQVKAGPEVRNFAQIAAGDRLKVQYKEVLKATRQPAGAMATPTEAAAMAGRAPAGDKPAAAVGVAVSLRVKVESIDRDREIVVFSTSTGEMVARHIVTSEGREFIKGLKHGDIVQLDYVEALALSIEKT